MAATPDPKPAVPAKAAAPAAGGGARQLIAPVVLAASLAALAGGVVYTIKTRPSIDVAALIHGAASLVEKGEYEHAIESLNTEVLPVVNAGLASEPEVATFFVLRARSVYEAAAGAGITREENFKAVIEDFGAARTRGAALEASDIVRLATSRLELGQTEEAIKEADALPVAEAEARRRLVKMAVTRSLKDPKAGFERTLGLLIELSQQPNISAEEAAWTLARQGELLLGVGRSGEAITKMLREMQLLRELPAASEAELHEILGRAYVDEGATAEAARQFERVISLTDPVSEQHAAAMVSLGHLRQASGQLDEARELFAGAIEHSDGSPAYLGALAGRASVLAAQGDDDGAMRDYAELIEKLPRAEKTGLLAPGVISQGLMDQYADRLAAGQTREALRYAVMAESLFGPDETPVDIVLALGAANRRLADELMGRAPVDEAGLSSPVEEPSRVDSVSREEAKRSYLAAGRYYARHASEVVITDAGSASRSRWLSADSFDLAGDVEEATKAFSGYLQGAPGQDPRRQEARYRLARIFQSVGDYGTAASLFSELLSERQSASDRGAMVWSSRSIVPLAQCFLADGEPGNDADAERELLAVLGGREFTPQAEEFREALIEVGKYYYESGRYSPAIERLTEAMTRFPDDPEIDRVRFRLADSQRLSAAEIERALTRAMPQAQREELEQTRRQRLREAMGNFERVRGSLLAMAPEAEGPVERVLLRNSTFYLGDCAYELEDYEGAIAAYDAARQQYDADPASLVALVQIVNAYVHQGQWAKAVTANERARQHLAKFPESVWTDPDLPMDKRHWERWLDSRSLLEQHARAGSSSGGEAGE